MVRDINNTLQETNIAMENPPIWWYLPGKRGIFVGYVSFREGNSNNCTVTTFYYIRPESIEVSGRAFSGERRGDLWRTGDDGWRIMKKDYQASLKGEPGSCDLYVKNI